MVEGEAADVLSRLDAPDSIFIGGGSSSPDLLESCWSALSSRGRLVVNVVTLEGESALTAFRADHGGDLARIAISRAEQVGPFTGWKPAMTVTQFVAVKS